MEQQRQNCWITLFHFLEGNIFREDSILLKDEIFNARVKWWAMNLTFTNTIPKLGSYSWLAQFKKFISLITQTIFSCPSCFTLVFCFLSFKMDIQMSIYVVYFNQQMGALYLVCWLKFAFSLFLHFFLFCASFWGKCCLKIHHTAITKDENTLQDFWHPMLQLYGAFAPRISRIIIRIWRNPKCPVSQRKRPISNYV